MGRVGSGEEAIEETGEQGPPPGPTYKIAQISDLHVGDPRFDESLLSAAIAEINEWQPDLFVVAGDLTTNGYEEEYFGAKGYLDKVTCPDRIVIAGNHDCRNVGYLYFEKMLGKRYHEREFKCALPGNEKIKVVALDSTKPDLNDGEIGREHYKFIREGFPADGSFNIFILHHHLIGIPGTGRERNSVWDAGDVLSELASAQVHLVLNGHKHVPYVWELGGMHVVTSGTVSTRRTRGFLPPSYNMIEIGESVIDVTMRTPGSGETRTTAIGRRR